LGKIFLQHPKIFPSRVTRHQQTETVYVGGKVASVCRAQMQQHPSFSDL